MRKEVLDYLEEIAMDKKMYVIRWMGIVFLKICFMMKIGVFVNEPAVLKVIVTVFFFILDNAFILSYFLFLINNYYNIQFVFVE